MTPLTISLRQTLHSVRLLWLLYGITLVLGLLVALPMYNTLKVEDQNSLAFLNLLQGFDYTVYTDFMHRSQRVISPLMSVSRWLGVVYVFLSLFVAGGTLYRFTQFSSQRTRVPFSVGSFWQVCSHYVGRFGRLFGVTLLFVVIGGGIWLVAGTLVGIMLNDSITERGQFWIGIFFFALALLTIAFVFCIGDYAKIIMFQEDERQAFRAFGRAGRLVIGNLAKTYGFYCLLILIGTALFGIYFLLDDLILMSGWLTILLMFLIQQSLVFARVGLKVWSLGMAYTIYNELPKPQPVLRPSAVAHPVEELVSSDESSALPAEPLPNQPDEEQPRANRSDL